MKTLASRNWGRGTLAVAGILALSLLASVEAEAKRKAPPPPPPPPPPPAVVVIPYRPVPPDGASPNFQPPMRGPDGLYVSVNRNITPAQTLWNLRSAYNVAALNCSPTEFPTIVDGYRAFLTKHSRALAAANRKVDDEFRARYGPRFVAPRERYMTEVYNHFALPMTLNDFCRAVLAVTYDGAMVGAPPPQLVIPAPPVTLTLPVPTQAVTSQTVSTQPATTPTITLPQTATLPQTTALPQTVTLPQTLTLPPTVTLPQAPPPTQAAAPARPVTPAELDAFAARSLPNIEIVFDNFYRRYEQWRVDAAAWDARYAPRQAIAPVASPTTSIGLPQ